MEQRLLPHGGGPLGVSQAVLSVAYRGFSLGAAVLGSVVASVLSFTDACAACQLIPVAGAHPPPARLETDLTHRLAFPASVHWGSWHGDIKAEPT